MLSSKHLWKQVSKWKQKESDVIDCWGDEASDVTGGQEVADFDT